KGMSAAIASVQPGTPTEHGFMPIAFAGVGLWTKVGPLADLDQGLMRGLADNVRLVQEALNQLALQVQSPLADHAGACSANFGAIVLEPFLDVFRAQAGDLVGQEL